MKGSQWWQWRKQEAEGFKLYLEGKINAQPALQPDVCPQQPRLLLLLPLCSRCFCHLECPLLPPPAWTPSFLMTQPSYCYSNFFSPFCVKLTFVFSVAIISESNLSLHLDKHLECQASCCTVCHCAAPSCSCTVLRSPGVIWCGEETAGTRSQKSCPHELNYQTASHFLHPPFSHLEEGYNFLYINDFQAFKGCC